jgi:hypothetical protein
MTVTYTTTTIDDPKSVPYANYLNIGVGAYDINDLGEIVGVYWNGSTLVGYENTYGVYTDVTPPGSTLSVANGINNSAQIAGYYGDANGVHGYIDTGGVLTVLNDPKASEGTYAFGISNGGEVAGFYLDASGNSHGFTYKKGKYSTIDAPGASQTTAFGVNKSGALVGYYDTGSVATGFLDKGGIFTTINDPNAAPNETFPYGINDKGVIVGLYFDNNGVAHGFVDTKGVFTTVNEPAAVNTGLSGVNNQGVAVGVYVDASGDYHGYVAIPSNPGTAVLQMTSAIAGMRGSDGASTLVAPPIPRRDSSAPALVSAVGHVPTIAQL